MLDYQTAIEGELKSYSIYVKSLGYMESKRNRLKESGGAEPLKVESPYPSYMSEKYLNEKYGLQLEYRTICNEIKVTKDAVFTIDCIMSELDKQSRDIITHLYFNGENVERVCQALGGQAPKTIYKYRNIALQKFAAILFSNDKYLSKLLT